MSWPFAPLTPNRYGIILADWPWRTVLWSEGGYGKSPERHYDTMSLDRIATMPVQKLAGPNCVYVMWSTWGHLSFAMEIMRVHGFEYKTGGAWPKRFASGKLAMGTGRILRDACEPFIIGTVGSPRFISRSERNYGDEADPVIEELSFETDDITLAFPERIDGIRREHSRKPDSMRAKLERLCPWARCVDLCAVESWPGHDIWSPKPHRPASPA